jgi:hypothetical protein
MSYIDIDIDLCMTIYFQYDGYVYVNYIETTYVE